MPNAGPPADALTGGEPATVAIPVLVEEYGGRLYQIARRFCGTPEEAEDLVQETFLQAFRHWDSFEGRARPTTWLYTIAARLCQRFHRKRSGEPDHLLSWDESQPFHAPALGVVPPEGDPVAEQVRREARERLEAAIPDLPEDFRMPFILREVAGLSVEEIARVMELKPATVKTRLHRARLRLRDAVEGALPKRELPPPALPRQVALDLLQARQEALDRGEPFRFPEDRFCERCQEFFATLELPGDLCRELASGDLPSEVRERLLTRLAAEGSAGKGA